MSETKAQAWGRLAHARGLKVTKYLRSFCKLTNRSHYEWNDQRAGTLLAVMFAALIETCKKYKLDSDEIFTAAKRQHALLNR